MVGEVLAVEARWDLSGFFALERRAQNDSKYRDKGKNRQRQRAKAKARTRATARARATAKQATTKCGDSSLRSE
jgi:hypothetical protein